MKLFEKYRNLITDIVYVIGLFSLVSAAISSLIDSIRHEAIFIISVIVLITALAYILINNHLKKNAVNAGSEPSNDDTNQIRGLFAFEEGENLIGRDKDIKQIQTILLQTNFKFGYISGEVGSGKTSLIRAGIIPILKKKTGILYIVNMLMKY